MSFHDPVAVFDLGKTNSKLFVIDNTGAIVAERRTKPAWVDRNGIRVLDEAALFAWMSSALAEVVESHHVRHVTFSGHGCTFALVGGGALQHPILDYEQDPPAEIAERIDRLLPGFAETFAPRLPLGLNHARHILWLAEREPHIFDKAEAILSYPQYWAWRFGGQPVSEVSYLGCHSCLWAPLADDFSSLVDKQGWRAKMPPFAPAGARLGTYDVRLSSGDLAKVAVHNGVHDSNAALFYYRALGFEDFTLVSTGTWVIIFNQACSLEALDSARDMLANVTVDHDPAATVRFMGGREFDVASGGWTQPIGLDAVEAVIAKGCFALPSFAAGGPVPEHEGSFSGPSVSGEERAAVALLYVVMMTDLTLDLIRSGNEIVIDGGLVKARLYAPMLAALRPQTIYASTSPEGTALGAAALVFRQSGAGTFKNESIRTSPAHVAGLDAYRHEWRRRVAELENGSGDDRGAKETSG